MSHAGPPSHPFTDGGWNTFCPSVSNAAGFAGGERTQNLVFPVVLTPDAETIEIDGLTQPLTSGMAVTVELKTGARRMLEYLFAPLVEVASKAMRER